MIIGTFNIRGRGSKLKRKKISQIISFGTTYIFMFQESKLEVVDHAIIRSF